MTARLGLFQSTSSEEDVVSTVYSGQGMDDQNVSIHVLRRGRCVETAKLQSFIDMLFQSTSSEEDVVSSVRLVIYHAYVMFQSTSSEEDVVSTRKQGHTNR